ncbi:MAG TPA: DUF3488 and transglutaminase-like domain-containing protein [Pengzhenrongella sp.]
MTGVPRGPRGWVAGGLCALAVFASAYALTGLINPGRWLAVAACSLALLAALLAGVRATTRARWAPTFVGLAAVGFGVLAAYASPPDRFQALPSTESLARLGDAIRAGLAYTNASRPPVEATAALELLVVGGALLVLIVVDLVAVGLGAPAWSGLVLLALWTPSIVLGHGASGWAFAGTATAYVLLLAVTTAPVPGTHGARGHRDATRRTSAAAAGAGAVTVAAIALGPLATAAPGWSIVGLPNLGSFGAGSLRLSEDLDMRESLGPRSNEVELTYHADPVLVGPLRVFTLRDFDGVHWSRDNRPTVVTPDPALLWPGRDLANRPSGEAAPTVSNLTVRIAGLREDRLPVPVMPRTVDVARSWSYDAERDEVHLPGGTPTGMVYSVRVDLLDLTAASLRAIGSQYPPGMDQYLRVPRTSRASDVAKAAAAVTSTASNHYDQALALQTYFRNAQTFTYSTKVPPGRTDDAVWDFLGSRTGYCVQFATAMTIMARTLGIPARLAVGFLPGSLGVGDAQVVSGRDSHAWPELYFPGAGWVRFEPTPAVQSGPPPGWADPFAAAGGAPVPSGDLKSRGAAPSGLPTRAPTTGGVTLAQGPDLRLTIGISGGIVILLLLVTAWLIPRYRSTRARDLSPEVPWKHLRVRLGAAGIAWSDARTPHQVAALVAAELVRRNGAPMRVEAEAALWELALAVQDHRYAPNPPAKDQGELERRVDVVLQEITSPVPVAVPST